MPRRRANRKGLNIVTYDFIAIFGAASKEFQCMDFGVDRGRPVRPHSISISAAIAGHTQCPALYLILVDTKEDVCATSRSIVLSTTSKRLSLRTPRSLDYGQWQADASRVGSIMCPGYYNGTITVSGSMIFEFQPHSYLHNIKLVFDESPSSQSSPAAVSEGPPAEEEDGGGVTPPRGNLSVSTTKSCDDFVVLKRSNSL